RLRAGRPCRRFRPVDRARIDPARSGPRRIVGQGAQAQRRAVIAGDHRAGMAPSSVDLPVDLRDRPTLAAPVQGRAWRHAPLEGVERIAQPTAQRLDEGLLARPAAEEGLTPLVYV